MSFACAHRIRSLCALSFSSLLSACTPEVDSEDVRTDGMYATFTAASYGATTLVQADLDVGGPNGTDVVLEGEDELWADVEGAERRLSTDPSGRGYSGIFDGNGDGAVVTVSLRRGEHDESAPGSQATMPPAFTVAFAGLERGGRWARGEPLVITWTPAVSGTIGYHAEGSCIIAFSGATGDDGEHTFSARDFRAFTGFEGEECDVSIELSRAGFGVVDPAFGEGGSFRTYQLRKINFTSTAARSE